MSEALVYAFRLGDNVPVYQLTHVAVEPARRGKPLMSKEQRFQGGRMLAEIFFLRAEAIARFSKEAAPAKTSRFVPLLPEAFNALKEQRENARSADGR
jgi:hypothetical protein